MNEMIELEQLWAEESVPSSQELAPSRRLLMAALHAPAPRARRYRSHVGLAAAWTAALTGAVIALQVGLGGSHGVPGLVAAPPANAQQLLKLAAQAAVRTDLHPAPGQYLHTVTRTQAVMTDGPDGRAYVIGDEERWVPVDAAKRWLMREHPHTAQTLPGSKPIPSWLMARLWPSGGADTLYESSCSKGHPERLDDWPTELNALRERVEADAAKGTAVPPRLRVWETIAVVLKDSVFQPALTAALYQLLAEVHEITLVPDVVDVAGRHGLGVAMDMGDDTRAELVFEKGTYRYLGEQSVAIRDVTTSYPTGKGRRLTSIVPAGSVQGTAILRFDLAEALPALASKVSHVTVPC